MSVGTWYHIVATYSAGVIQTVYVNGSVVSTTGSVALAGSFTGVYPSASPGGWLLIGRTSTPLFDVAAEPPALLSPGTKVRFVDA